MKKLLRNLSFCLLAGSLFAACGKKEPEPGPGYYFKFKADDVAYHYEYERKVGFVGTASNMGAFQSTSTAWGGTLSDICVKIGNRKRYRRSPFFPQ